MSVAMGGASRTAHRACDPCPRPRCVAAATGTARRRAYNGALSGGPTGGARTVKHSLGKAIALVGAVTILGAGCAWTQRVSHPAANDPLGAAPTPPALSADGRYIAYAAHTDT